MTDNTSHYGSPEIQAEIAAWKVVLKMLLDIQTQGDLRLVINRRITPLPKELR